MLINISNHSCTSWGLDQLNTAKSKWSRVVDLLSPMIPPEAGVNDLIPVVNDYVKKVQEIAKLEKEGTVFIHVMGELTFTFMVIAKLQREGFQCVASTTKRDVIEENGIKLSEFKFVQFRVFPKFDE
ncbi:MAG: CRISPR-associated protein [Sphingobacteriia bacterium]|nr:CRISPR-associated protein [Sphingobacteriia bacterium]